MDKSIGAKTTAFFNRALQKAEETFNTAEKTPLDAQTENLIRECDKRKNWAESLISQIENCIQPNPAVRIEDMVLKGLDKKKERSSAGEQLGDSMSKIGEQMGSNSVGGATLMKCGKAQTSIGEAERTFQQRATDEYLNWLRQYVSNDCKLAKQERDKLDEARLDLDRTKTQLKRAKEDKKSEHEQALTEAQTAFTRQCDATKHVLEQTISAFDAQKPQVLNLLQAQSEYFEACLDAVRSAMR